MALFSFLNTNRSRTDNSTVNASVQTVKRRESEKAADKKPSLDYSENGTFTQPMRNNPVVNAREKAGDTTNGATRRFVPDLPAMGASGADSPVVNKPESAWERPGGLNTFAQAGRVLGGWVQGAMKSSMAMPMMMEDISNRVDASVGRDRTFENLMCNEPTAVEVTRTGNAAVQGLTDSWLPAPASGGAQFIATASDALGEALPGTALAASGGGLPGMLTGTVGSYLYGSLNAAGTEMVEGSGNAFNAAIAGSVEAATEIIGGQTIGKLAAGISNPVVSTLADAAGEGLEEIGSGFTTSFLTGKEYTLKDALNDGAVGAVVGGVIAGSGHGVKAAAGEIATQRTIGDIKAGKASGAIEGLHKSVEIAEANPGEYGEIAAKISEPGQVSDFDSERFGSFIRAAVDSQASSQIASVIYDAAGIDPKNKSATTPIKKTIGGVISQHGHVTPQNINAIKSDTIKSINNTGITDTKALDGVRDAVKNADIAVSPIRVPGNIGGISARNVGGYETLTRKGMARAASILESAQESGLSPGQSGRVLRATLETNDALYSQLSEIGRNANLTPPTVTLERGAEYRSMNDIPISAETNNYSVHDVDGKAAARTEADAPINIFRGMSSEWVIPTMDAGQFVVPNAPAEQSGEGDTNNKALFGSSPGQMLGAGLYLTSVPSKADQYTSGVQNDISIAGSDSRGIMANSPLFGGTTYINRAALADVESGGSNDTVMRGSAGNGTEAAMAAFINNAHAEGNSDAAAVYSKFGDQYTEIVRPDASTTQVERLYMPANEVILDAEISAEELGAQRATEALNEAERSFYNPEVSPLLDTNVPGFLTEPITTEGIDSDARDDANPLQTTEAAHTTDIPMGTENPSITEAPPAVEAPPITEAPPTTDTPPTTESPPVTDTPPTTDTPLIEVIPPDAYIPPPIKASPNTDDPIRTDAPPTADIPLIPEIPSIVEVPPTAKAPMQTNTPVQIPDQDRDDKLPEYNSNLMRGQGATGEVFETMGYNQSFGIMSSG